MHFMACPHHSNTHTCIHLRVHTRTSNSEPCRWNYAGASRWSGPRRALRSPLQDRRSTCVFKPQSQIPESRITNPAGGIARALATRPSPSKRIVWRAHNLARVHTHKDSCVYSTSHLTFGNPQQELRGRAPAGAPESPAVATGGMTSSATGGLSAANTPMIPSPVAAMSAPTTHTLWLTEVSSQE